MHDPTAWNWAGLGSCAAMATFVLLAVWLSPRIQRWAEKPEPPRSNAIDSSNYQPPPHMHVMDFERSKILVCSDGSVIASCAVQGCKVTALLGRNVAHAIVVEEPRS